MLGGRRGWGGLGGRVSVLPKGPDESHSLLGGREALEDDALAFGDDVGGDLLEPELDRLFLGEILESLLETDTLRRHRKRQSEEKEAGRLFHTLILTAGLAWRARGRKRPDPPKGNPAF